MGVARSPKPLRQIRRSISAYGRPRAVEFGYCKLIEELAPGVTHFELHATVSGEIEAISPQPAPWYTNEYALFASGAFARWRAQRDIAVIGYRDIQPLWARSTS